MRLFDGDCTVLYYLYVLLCLAIMGAWRRCLYPPQSTSYHTLIPSRVRGNAGGQSMGTWQHGRVVAPVTPHVPLGTVVCELPRGDSEGPRKRHTQSSTRTSAGANAAGCTARHPRTRIRPAPHSSGTCGARSARSAPRCFSARPGPRPHAAGR